MILHDILVKLLRGDKVPARDQVLETGHRTCEQTGGRVIALTKPVEQPLLPAPKPKEEEKKEKEVAKENSTKWGVYFKEGAYYIATFVNMPGHDHGAPIEEFWAAGRHEALIAGDAIVEKHRAKKKEK